jgi:hypothetical protein
MFHGAGSTDTLAERATENERWVDLICDFDECIENLDSVKTRGTVRADFSSEVRKRKGNEIWPTFAGGSVIPPRKQTITRLLGHEPIADALMWSVSLGPSRIGSRGLR